MRTVPLPQSPYPINNNNNQKEKKSSYQGVRQQLCNYPHTLFPYYMYPITTVLYIYYIEVDAPD
ncbi:hypothetical protein PP707_05060 [Acetobacter pasteurianus]|nr:hypothetical protein [Acetobacter pasteurianus]